MLRTQLLWRLLPSVMVVTSALPYFLVGLLLILFFSIWINGFLPSDFNYDPSIPPGFSAAYSTRNTTSPSPGDGSGTSASRRAEVPANPSSSHARM